MKDAFDISDWKEQKRHLLEKDIQGPSVKKARAAGWWARKFSAAPGRTSVPDYIFGKATDAASDLDVLRRIAERGIILAQQHRSSRHLDLWQHMADEIARLPKLAKYHVFFVEFKKPGGKATEKQLEEHKLMRAAGLKVYVCDTVEQFAAILDAEEKFLSAKPE